MRPLRVPTLTATAGCYCCAATSAMGGMSCSESVMRAHLLRGYDTGTKAHGVVRLNVTGAEVQRLKAPLFAR